MAERKIKQKQLAFYMTQRSEADLNEIQDIIEEMEGKVTKAWIVNQAISHYLEYTKEKYNMDKK